MKWAWVVAKGEGRLTAALSVAVISALALYYTMPAWLRIRMWISELTAIEAAAFAFFATLFLVDPLDSFLRRIRSHRQASMAVLVEQQMSQVLVELAEQSRRLEVLQGELNVLEARQVRLNRFLAKNLPHPQVEDYWDAEWFPPEER